MGQTGSRVVSKLFGAAEDESGAASGSDGSAIARFNGGRNTALVFSRRGSMYFDEDGDLAHEFYEEVRSKRAGHRHLRRVHSKHLTPQGDVKYPHPRLHVDFPIVLIQG